MEPELTITPLTVQLAPAVEALMGVGAPYIRARTPSDYWLYAKLFSSTCPVALINNTVVGAVVAFRSQDDPAEVYIQDVMTHPDHRKRGIATALLTTVHNKARDWGCTRVYLTSEPDNTAGHITWTSLGYVNIPGDRNESGVWVTTDYKGPGRHRAVYQLELPEEEPSAA